MKLPSKTVITLISIPVLILLFFSSNIYGYFRFKHYCSTEGGLRVYEKLERNVGWWAKDKYDARTVALLDGVGFVRYTDQKDGQTYDIKYIGGDPQDDSSFERKFADEARLLLYRWKYINYRIPEELRLGRHGYEVLNINNDRVLVNYYMFGYSKFERSHTLFDAPSGVGCFDEKSVNDEPSLWRKELNTAFK